MGREITDKEKEMLKSLVAEKLKLLTSNLETAISVIFRKRMAFGLIMFDSEGSNKAHVYVSNVAEKDALKNALNIIIDMLDNPQADEEGILPTIQ